MQIRDSVYPGNIISIIIIIIIMIIRKRTILKYAGLSASRLFIPNIQAILPCGVCILVSDMSRFLQNLGHMLSNTVILYTYLEVASCEIHGSDMALCCRL